VDNFRTGRGAILEIKNVLHKIQYRYAMKQGGIDYLMLNHSLVNQYERHNNKSSHYPCDLFIITRGKEKPSNKKNNIIYMRPTTWEHTIQTRCSNILCNWQQDKRHVDMFLFYCVKYKKHHLLNQTSILSKQLNLIRLIYYAGYFDDRELISWIRDRTYCSHVSLLNVGPHLEYTEYYGYVYVGYCAIQCDDGHVKDIVSKIQEQDFYEKKWFSMNQCYCVLAERGISHGSVIFTPDTCFYMGLGCISVGYFVFILDRTILKSYFQGACQGGHLPLIKALVEEQNIAPNHGIVKACYGGDLHVVQYLIAKGATINDDCLIKAAAQGHLNTVKYLLGIKIFKISVIHQVMEKAVKKGHVDIVKCMLDNYSKIDKCW
jgi:hypothetical protein